MCYNNGEFKKLACRKSVRIPFMSSSKLAYTVIPISILFSESDRNNSVSPD